MRRALALPLILCMMSSALLAAEQAPRAKIDLASAADLAIKQNLTIKASQQTVTTAGHVVDRAKGQSGVNLNLNASYYHLDAPITLDPETITVAGVDVVIPGQTVANEDVYSANVTLSYPLFNGKRLHYGVRSAQYGESEAKNNACDTQLSVVLQTVRTYLAAIFSRENVKANEESLKSYEEHWSVTKKSRQQGVATDYDVTRAESAVEDQKKRLVEVRNQYELALANLRTVLFLSRDCPIDLQGGFFDVPGQNPVSQSEESAVKATPLLHSIADRSSSLLMSEKSVRAEAKPQLDAVGLVNLFNRENGFLTSSQWFVGFQLSQSIFDSGVIQARADELRSERDKNNTELQSAADSVRLSVRSAYLDMSTACSAIAAARKSVELAKESLRLAERRFAEGVGTSLEVLDANVNLLSAKTGLQQSFYQLDSAYLTIRRYLGDIVQVAHTAQSAGVSGAEGRSLATL